MLVYLIACGFGIVGNSGLLPVIVWAAVASAVLIYIHICNAIFVLL